MKTNTPIHYRGDGKVTSQRALRSMLSAATGLQPIMIYWWSNAFKYLWRWNRKNGVEDLDKCIDCIKRLKKELKKRKAHK